MITPFDWAAAPIYIIFFLILAFFWRGFFDDKYVFKHFLWGLTLKMFSAIAFALIYVYGYGSGDTFSYFEFSIYLKEVAFEQTDKIVDIYFSSSEEMIEKYPLIVSKIRYAATSEEWFMIKILMFLNIFSLGSFLVMNIVISAISFVGVYHLARIFISAFPNHKGIAIISAFYVPSVIFWSSGLLKDTLVFAMVGFFVYSIYQVLFLNRYKVKYIFMILFSAYLIFNLKDYVLITLLPAIAIALYFKWIKRIEAGFYRFFLGPTILVVFLGISFASFQYVILKSEEYNSDSFFQKTKGFHSWHETTGGSYYNLGEIEYNFGGVISKIPAALNVTLFRPYIWEVRSGFMLLTSLESMLFLFFSVIVIVISPAKTFKFLFGSPILILSLFYIIFLGFIVGFTSYNFGALARYKIPLMPFLMFLILIIWHEVIRKRYLIKGVVEEEKLEH